MTEEQFCSVQDSYKHSDTLVFQVGKKIYISEEVLKHRKEATIEMMNCSEVDDTCFDDNGYDYDGTVCPGLFRIILQDPFAEFDNTVASVYYDDEVVLLQREVVPHGERTKHKK